MKVITQSLPFLKVVPRIYPIVSDILILEFESGIEIDFEWEIENDLLKITLLSTDLFTQRDNYSFTILRGTDIIYKGKMIFLKDNTDVQNYTNQSQDNKRWQ